ncbi:MAG: SPOR domain-containing protein [Lactobacillales bacterium]|jgi:hypothetical protein|nr:SPOR domain-containing protein [Lactobacillales bacterium]
MDEFDKMNTSDENQKNDTPQEGDENPYEEEVSFRLPAAQDDADDVDALASLRSEYKERFGFSPTDEDLPEKSLSSMKFHIIALSIFIGALLVVIAGFLFFGEEPEQPEEMVMITASSSPVKVRPEQPGGLQIPDQEKMIYDRIRTDNVPVKVEKLFPEPEKPIMPDTLTVRGREEIIPEAPMIEAPKPQVVPIVAAPIEKPVAAPAPVKPEAAKPAPKPAPVTSTTAKPVVTVIADSWKVQLLSSSNKSLVEKEWPKILQKNKALLSNMPHEIKKVDIQGRGTFYRLRVGNFKTKEQANTLCQKLKAAKQECIPSK